MTRTHKICAKAAGLALTLLLCLTYLAGADGVLIELKEACEVAGDQAALAEVAAITGADSELEARLSAVTVGAAPLPGKTRDITCGMVRARLLAAGIDMTGISLLGPERTIMSRLSQIVPGQQIADAVIEAVRARVPWTEDELQLEPARIPSDEYLPLGDLELAVNDEPTFRSFGNMTVPVDLTVDGKRVKSISVALRGTLQAQVVVAARDIDRLSVLAPEDVAVKLVEITTAPDSLLVSPAEAVGRRATRLIRAGTPIASDTLEEPPAVLKGETITVTARAGAVVATTLATASQDGKIGQIIKATPVVSAGQRATGGKTSLMVRVTGAGEAEARS
jgi:flagella basal body P-ring formation protein FlgA